MKSWHAYYSNRPRSITNLLLHWQYLLRILWLRPKSLLEIGCGPAQHALFIKRLLPNTSIYLLDKDKKLLQGITDIDINKIFADVLDKQAILEKVPKIDLVMSQGLVEHFTDKQVIRLVENFRSKTKRLLFGVPSKHYPTLDYGNEILRSVQEYKTILSKVDKIKFQVIPYLDFGLRTKLLKIRVRENNLRQIIKLLFFESNHLLIEILYENSF